LSGFGAYLPENLSVGQLRCGALARALVARPSLAILDDPVGGSDPFIEQTIISVLEYAVAHEGLCALIASNSARLMRKLPCRGMLLEAGALLPFETIRETGFSSLPTAVRELIEAYEQR
jgi:ABC-type ATPase involved in cell division